MSELIIRRDRTFVSPQYQAAKAGKAAAAGQSQPAARKTGLTVAATLQEMTAKSSQMAADIRESRRTLQVGQGVLAEVKDSLDRLAQLARQAAGDGEVDREAIQKEMEQLREEIGRMIGSAAAGDTPLFTDGDSEIKDVARLLMQLMAKAEAGVSPDQAIQELTGGAFNSVAELQEQLASGALPGLQETLLDLMAASGGGALLKLLAGMQGGNLDLLLKLMAGLQTTEAGPESSADLPAPEKTALPGQKLGPVQVTGRDLSGAAFDRKTGALTISGPADVAVQGMGEKIQSIRITGTGTVTLRDVTGTLLTVESAQARIDTAGQNALREVRLGEDTVLTLGGEGRLELEAVRGGEAGGLRLAGGAVIIKGEDGGTMGRLAIPVVLEGPAVLAAQAAQVTDAAGRRQEPFDLIWKALLPGWSGLTELEAEGKLGKLALLSGDPARLWLTRGDPNHGFPAHTLVLRNQEESGQIRTRYAYLQWNKPKEAFEEVTMYPNPFAVTGGEAERDWLYEEETQTLHILSSQVTAVSGGAGVDANQVPFSGRIALANGIGAVELTLEGVICQVVSGRAFDLGEENQVTLVLPNGTSSLFASGAGCAGITLGEGTLLCVDCPQPDGEDEAGTLAAAGGLGCAGIGRDGVAGWDPADPVLIRSAGGEEEHNFLGPVIIAGGAILPAGEEPPEGVPLQAGEETVVLPQFRLSVQALGLSGMSMMTREYARDAQAVLEASQQRIAQIQSVYGVLYHWLDQGARALPGAASARSAVRSPLQADTLLEDMRRTILLHPTQAMRTHSRREVENTIRQLLK